MPCGDWLPSNGKWWLHMTYLSISKPLLIVGVIVGAVGIAGSPSVPAVMAAQVARYSAKEIPPPSPKAARVRITEEATLESFRNNEAIITWTTNNPGGTDEHFGLVRYGTDPQHLNLTAKSHIRLNRNHPNTVFRVRVPGLQPRTTYYYTVHTQEARGTDDGLKSRVYRITTPDGA
jgi:phosphodiesterase/alkaline phosphatase D-like protein